MSVDGQVYEHMSGLLNQDSVVIDIGAYNGNVSRKLCENSGGDPSKYFLIEPCPDNFKILSQRSQSYNLFNIAIAAHSGTVNLYTANHKESDGSSQGNSIHKGFVEKNKWSKNINRHEVKCATLDTFLEENGIGAVEFLKINCEGGEYEIFSSTIDFLNKTDYIYLQLHGKYDKFLTGKAINQKTAITNQLDDAGFSLIIGDSVKDIPNIKTHIHQLWGRHAI